MQLAVLAAVAVALPAHGTLVPGRSLGGVRLGDRPARVLRLWGRNHGVCANCRRTTWYYNYARYEPQGAGVEFSRGRVAAVFTLWSPKGWRGPRGLRLGDPADRIRAAYGLLPMEHCTNYDAYAIVAQRNVTVFYVFANKLWGFALTRPSVSVCR
jgi:hypothetical protein